MARTNIHYEVEPVTLKTGRWGDVDYTPRRVARGDRRYDVQFASSRDALVWAYRNVGSSPVMISKCWDVLEGGEFYGECDCEPYGFVKAVTRKSGRAVVFTKYAVHSQMDTYTADVTVTGTLKNKR